MKQIANTFRLIFIVVLLMALTGAVGYVFGNRLLDRDKLEDEIRADIEQEVIQDLEADIRESYEDELEQAQRLEDETVQQMIDALISDIQSRVEGVNTTQQLQEFDAESEFGI